jgi:hypothetical protein
MRWPVVDGVPHFVSEVPYWDEIPEPRLQDLLGAATTEPWREVFRGRTSGALVGGHRRLGDLSLTNS